MNIAILNESFLSEAHLAALRELGNVVVYENTDTEEKAIERLKDADVAIADCFIAPLNRRVFESVPSLKFLSINSTGFDFVDVDAAKENKILIAHVPGFSTDAVAEQVFALLFAVNRKVVSGDVAMRKAPFQIDPGNQEQRKFIGFNLIGKTLGVIGLGNIGSRVAQIGLGLGMNVVAYSRSEKGIVKVPQVTLEELLKQSDVVSVNVSFSKETKKMIAKEELELMKPEAILINTAPGKCIDEAALIETLRARKIGGAGLDVLTDWTEKNPILSLDNVVLSPHSGFFTKESLNNCADIIVENVRGFAHGKSVNIVNS